MSDLSPSILVESNNSDLSETIELDDCEYTKESLEEYLTELGFTDYSITDSTDLPHNTDLDDLDELCEVARLVNEHGKPYLKYVEWSSNTEERAYLGSYKGKYSDFTKFVKSYASDNDMIPERLMNFINWDKYAKEFLYDFAFVDGYVFSNSY